MRAAVTMRSTSVRVYTATATAHRRTAAASPMHLHLQQRRSLWPFSLLKPRRQRRPSAAANAAAAAARADSSASPVVLPASTGKALRALGPNRDRHDRLGIGFSAGGLLFPYYVGVAYGLKEAGALVPGVTPLAGASAGSLIAACVGTGLGKKEVEVR